MVSQSTLKNVILFLFIIVLINPIIIYLVTGSVLASISVPLIIGILVFFLRGTKTLRLLNIILINLVFVIGFFLHAETIFTYRFEEYSIEDLYEVKGKYYFNRPYLNQTFRDKEFIVQYKTNKQGFRIGTEDDPDTEVQYADWLFIGDSYTQGAQVQYEELYTSRLFDSFPNKIIVNAGISGLGIADEYNYYINEGKNLKAKKVFLQICNFNDFMNVKERTSGFSDYLMHYSNFARYILYDFKYANPAELPLGRWTEPFYPDEKSNITYNIFYKKQNNQKKEDLRMFEHFLKQFNEKVRQNGAELVVLEIPTKEQVYYKYLDEVVRNFQIDVAKLDMLYPNKVLDRICKENGIHHIDLLSDFTEAENELFFQFDEHLNIDGHYQLAKSIAKYIKQVEQDMHVPTKLSILNVGDRYPNFPSSSCNTLVYQSFRDGNMELFMSDSFLKQPQRITWNNVDELHPGISPDGRMLIFTEGDQANNKTRVVAMNVDGSERRYVTEGENTFGAIPSFDYTGQKVTYAEWKSDNNGKLSNPYIVVFDLVDGSKSFITSDSVENWRPVFSYDNKKIYFIAKDQKRKFDIYEFTLESAVKRNITNSKYEEWDPVVSKDGTKIVYAANKNGNWDLFIKELKTNKTTQLTNSLGNEWDPALSPCGRFIYYSGTFGLRNGIFRIELNE